MKVTVEPIILDQYFDGSISDVWEALTELDQMHLWYFDNIPAFEPRVGFKTSFDVQAPSRIFRHEWEVSEVIEGEKIAYIWTFGSDIPGAGVTTFSLVSEGEGTRLHFNNTVLADFPSDIPEFKRESGVEGWNYFINDRLKNYLEK